MNIEIKNRFSNRIIITGEYADIREAVLKARVSGVDLFGADLSGADLYGADLRMANLSGAKSIPSITNAQASILPESGQF